MSYASSIQLRAKEKEKLSSRVGPASQHRLLQAEHAARGMGLLCERRAHEAGEDDTAAIQGQRHS